MNACSVSPAQASAYPHVCGGGPEPELVLSVPVIHSVVPAVASNVRTSQSRGPTSPGVDIEPWIVCPIRNGVAWAKFSLGSTSPTLPVIGLNVPIACSVHVTYSAPRRGPFVRSTAVAGNPPSQQPKSGSGPGSGLMRSVLGLHIGMRVGEPCTSATTNGGPKLAPWSVDLRPTIC